MKSILDYETVALIDEDDAIEIIDQTLLPGTTKIIRLHTGQEIWDAIYLLQVRGAPAIGVSAGFGLYLLMKHSKAGSYEEFCAELKEKSDFLNSSRPTAVNLSWALKRMEKHAADFYETELKAAGLIKKEFDGVKVLGNGDLSVKVTVKAAKFSQSAVEKIEKAGGKTEVM